METLKNLYNNITPYLTRENGTKAIKYGKNYVATSRLAKSLPSKEASTAFVQKLFVAVKTHTLSYNLKLKGKIHKLEAKSWILASVGVGLSIILFAASRKKRTPEIVISRNTTPEEDTKKVSQILQKQETDHYHQLQIKREDEIKKKEDTPLDQQEGWTKVTKKNCKRISKRKKKKKSAKITMYPNFYSMKVPQK